MLQNHQALEESPTKQETSFLKKVSEKQSEFELIRMTSFNRSMNEFDKKELCDEGNNENHQIKGNSQRLRLSQMRMLTDSQSLEKVQLKQLYEQYFDLLQNDGKLTIISYNVEEGRIFLIIRLESGDIQKDIIYNHKKQNQVVHLKDVDVKNFTKVTCQKLSLKQIEEELKFEKQIQSHQLEIINIQKKTQDKLIQKIKDLKDQTPNQDADNQENQSESIQQRIIELQNQLNQLEEEIFYNQFNDQQEKQLDIQQQIYWLKEKGKADILRQEIKNLEEQFNQQEYRLSDLEKLYKIQSEKIDKLEYLKNGSKSSIFRTLKSYQGEYNNNKKKEGQGKLIQYENEFIIEYQGQWVNGKKQGQGILTKSSRNPFSQIYSKYEGSFEKNLFTGFGTKYYNKNDTKYQQGQFKKGKEVGEHILTLIQNNQVIKRRKIYYNYCFFNIVYEEPI